MYTTFGTTLLGVIINNIGLTHYGKTYIQLYNEWIRDVAGLTNLTAEYNNLINGIAVGYSPSNVPETGYWDDIGWKLPAGGFVATAHDLAAYGAGVINHTFINTGTSITMWQTQTTSGTPVNFCTESLTSNFGLAFQVGGSGSNLRISHNGLNDHGFSSLLYLYPRRDAGIVFLTNKYEETGALDDLRQTLESIILCPNNRQFTSNISSSNDWIYEANNIEASNTFSASVGEIIFDGANEVVLKPGFIAQSGVKFRAIIDGCLGIVNPYKTE